MQFSLQENMLRILLVRWLSVRSAGHQAMVRPVTLNANMHALFAPTIGHFTFASSFHVESPANSVALAVLLVKLFEFFGTHAFCLS